MPKPSTHTAIPLTILAGFLGSGKTTVLNYILHNPGGRRITAIVNDFGALNIDQEIIAQKHGNQISLANGCVCCSVGDDLTRTLFEILTAPNKPDHILIEASGVSDPARIAAFASVDRELHLEGIIGCIDTVAYARQSQDPRLEDTMERQVNAAHILLATKTDLLGEADWDGFEEMLTKTNGQKERPIIKCVNGAVPPEIILGLHQATDLPSLSSTPISHQFKSFSGHLSAITPEALNQQITKLEPHLIRAKGITQDADGPYIFHYAGGHWSIERNSQISPSGHFVLIGFEKLNIEKTIFAC